MKIRILTTITAASTLFSAPSTLASPQSCQANVASKPAPKTVVQIAASNDDFSTLVAAVQAAGLAEALSGDGPFTIFAPTNDAFAKLPAGTVESLLKPENKGKLQQILTLHTVGGKVMASDVKPGKVKTLNGESIEVATAEGTVTVNSAKITKTDILGSNGVIHVIDTVILPKS